MVKPRRLTAPEQAVADASAALPDTLAALAPLAVYRRMELGLRFCAGHQLAASQLAWVMELLRLNMAPVFGAAAWPAEERSRRAEADSREAHYAFAHSSAAADADAPPLGFVHFRFVVEEGVAVLYVYELQVTEAARGKGLGRFLMLFMELLAKQSPGGLGGVVLTIQRANVRAARFYAEKCKYALCDISPAKTDPFAAPEEYNYDIWCKYLGNEAGAKAAAVHARIGAEARLQNAVAA